MKKQIAVLLTAGVIAAGAAVRAQDRDPSVPANKSGVVATPLATQEAVVSAVKESFVVVEYTLQYDKGDAPEGSRGYDENNGEQLIREERPLQQPGLLVDATHVVTSDIQLHPRFIKEIKVRRVTPEGKAGEAVSAAISSYAKEQNAVTLELAGAISGSKPAVFDAKRAAPYSIVQYVQDEGRWIFKLEHFAGELAVIRGKSVFSEQPGLVVDHDGVAVGISTATEMPADGWKGDPKAWPVVTGAEMAKLLSTVENQANNGVVRVMLNFRSPKNSTPQGMEGMPGQQENSTVQHVLGVAVDPHTLLVLAELKPTVTARLERIRVYTDPPMDAKFKGTLQDFGAFVVETEKPITGGPAFSGADFLDLRNVVLPSAEIYLQGEKRVAYFQPRRIDRFAMGWRGNLFPLIFQDTTNLFLFDQEGKLLAMPLAQREKASVSESQRYGGHDDRMTPVAQLAPVLSSLKENSDPNNVPLTEEEENRLAWVGVELQAMSQELARANSVSDLTKDGETGGLVTFVYPGSPAAKAGVEPGWILLRVDVEGQPKPIDVQVESDRFGGQPFPWDRLGDASESVFDRIPTPWPSRGKHPRADADGPGFRQKICGGIFA